MKVLMRIAVSFIAVFACMVLIQAATIQVADTYAASNLISEILPVIGSTSGSIQIRNNTTSVRWLGSGFSVSTATNLDKITFLMMNLGSNVVGSTSTIRIYSLSTLTSSPAVSATPLYSETGTVTGSYTGNNTYNGYSAGYITYDLATPFTLTAGTNYGILISLDTVSGGDYFNIYNATGAAIGGSTGFGYLFYTSDSRALCTENS